LKPNVYFSIKIFSKGGGSELIIAKLGVGYNYLLHCVFCYFWGVVSQNHNYCSLKDFLPKSLFSYEQTTTFSKGYFDVQLTDVY